MKITWGVNTSFFKLENLTNYLGGAQIWCKDVSAIHGQAHKGYHATVNAMLCKAAGKKYIVQTPGLVCLERMFSMAARELKLKCKIFMGTKDIKRQAPNVKQ